MTECKKILTKGAFSPDFLTSETRNGFFVSSQMKAVWMVELDLLKEAARVFEKYGIPWFAIGGTLLGAIRHNGFIPWDDDIDIAIPRSHYNRLRKIAETEFKHPYFYQDELNSPGVLCGHAKLRNSNTTCISPGYLEEINGCCKFNMGIFIDIFPLDVVPDDSAEATHWINEISDIAKNAWKLRKYSHRNYPKADALLDLELSHLGKTGVDKMFKLYEDLCGFYASSYSEKSCIYSLYVKNKKWIFNSQNFLGSSLCRFENMMIPIPKNPDEILTQLYNDWNVMKQLPSMHGAINDSFFDTERPYTTYCDLYRGIDKEKVLNLLRNNKE